MLGQNLSNRTYANLAELLETYDRLKQHAGLGENDRAIEWLENAFQDRSSLLIDSRLEFPFASLYDDPRYQALLKRMNLPE